MAAYAQGDSACVSIPETRLGDSGYKCRAVVVRAQMKCRLNGFVGGRRSVEDVCDGAEDAPMWMMRDCGVELRRATRSTQ